MRSTLPFCHGLYGLVYMWRTPSAASRALSSRLRYPGPLSVMTRSTATPRPAKKARHRAMNAEQVPLRSSGRSSA